MTLRERAIAMVAEQLGIHVEYVAAADYEYRVSLKQTTLALAVSLQEKILSVEEAVNDERLPYRETVGRIREILERGK
jgi:hypothetical protein